MPQKITIDANFWKLLGAVATIAMISYGFYYDTNKGLETNTASIIEIKEDLDEIVDIVHANTTFKGVSESEFKSLDQRIGFLDDNMKSIEKKQDIMIDLMTRLIAKNE